MKRCIHYLPVVLALFIFSFFISDNITAQKKSRRAIYHTHENSSSTKSSATNSEGEKNNFTRDKININNESDKFRNKGNNYRQYETKSSENYFRIDKSSTSLWDGKHWNESNFPLRIYVEESFSEYYKSVYKDYVKYAMDVWRKADDRIQYVFENSIDDADVSIIFVENLGDKYDEDFLGLTDYDINSKKQIEFSNIQISLIKNGTEKISTGEIKATIVHELGHALGLGHSDNKIDLMYPYISSDHSSEMTYDELSKGDKLAIKDAINLCFNNQYVWK